MDDVEKQPLNRPQEWDMATTPVSKPATTIATIEKQKSEFLNVLNYKSFEAIADNVLFNIEESHHTVQKLMEAHKIVYEHTPNTDSAAQKNRRELISQTKKLDDRLQYIRSTIVTIEPSKPGLTDLDLRNRKYKLILRSYKDVLEKYIYITLESQRYTSVLFEQYIKSVNPHATPFDLERAISSTGEDSPSVFVQVLMQRGVRRNDKEIQYMMHIVQDIHGDLRQLAITFTKLSEMRSQVNILIERYRRRWPVILREGDSVFVIDDDLNVLQTSKPGTLIDFDLLLRKRESRNKLIAGIITLVAIILVAGIVVSTTLFSEF